MERSSTEWDVSKELEGGSYYIHKDNNNNNNNNKSPLFLLGT
jgi:hypothetical protein